MKKINENKFWQKLVSEFYTQDQLNQESYNCLNAFLECPEIIAIQQTKDLDEDECNRRKNKIFELLDVQKQCDKKRKYRAGSNSPGHSQVEKYDDKQEKYISEFMKKCAVYLLLQKMCQDIGGELFRIQNTRVKYDRYGQYRNTDLGVHTPSPVIDLIVGNMKRGELYKRKPIKMDHVFRFKYREDGNLISAFLYLKEKPRYFCSVLYFGRYIFYLKYSVVGMLEEDISFLSYLYIIKYEKNKPEYLEKVNCISDSMISSIERERYIYKDNFLDKWMWERYLFPEKSLGIEEGKFCQNLFTMEYDKNGCIYGYTLGQDLDQKKMISSQNICHIQRGKCSDTGKNAMRWKYPPIYFD